MKRILVMFSVIAYLFWASVVRAASVPTFPSCSNPSGNIKVEYVSGLHAIVGDSALREGSDKVYSLFDGNTLQCFCPENGAGIQTNWWKLSGLSQEEINSLKTQGWNFVPNGADWGLSVDPYLAKNVDYSCKSGGGSSTSSSGGGIGGGSTSSVLGLAATGDNTKYIALVSLGIASVTGGLILRKKNA